MGLVLFGQVFGGCSEHFVCGIQIVLRCLQANLGLVIWLRDSLDLHAGLFHCIAKLLGNRGRYGNSHGCFLCGLGGLLFDDLAGGLDGLVGALEQQCPPVGDGLFGGQLLRALDQARVMDADLP